ncbi:MAG TPA: Crp/Fnr family transcriptional regulator [Thermoflexia bacterium]|jgi:CRP-like cAMP-binding protein|nr:Crp/Fnr family transcriptional regulator [Thermoflexia bacterium]
MFGVDPETLEDLQAISLFADLSDAALACLAQTAVRRTFAAGEIIIVEGDPCRAAYFIAEGQVRVFRTSPGGREQVLTRLGPGQAFNTVPPFLAQGRNHATVQAITRVVLYAVPAEDLRRLVLECPELALSLLHDFARRLDHLTDLVESLSLQTVRGRLARFLLEHAEAGQVTRRWTQEEIAAHLGTVRDMVGRTLRAFAEAGLIRLDRQRIVLLDRKGLEEEAGR